MGGMAQAVEVNDSRSMEEAKRRLGLWLGPLVGLLFLMVPTGLPEAAARTAAVTVWIAAWWVTEAMPIPAASLLPLVLLPAWGVQDVEIVAKNYGHPLIFLFLGGFLMALSLEKWGLHRRMAVHTIRAIGTSPSRLVLGFMLATGFLSMWLSNTATAMLMLPTGLAVIARMEEAVPAEQGVLVRRFEAAILLGIAYAASIGGVGTLVGSPPNLVLAASMEKLAGIKIGFGQWMLMGVPLAAVGLILSWWYLAKRAYPLPKTAVPGLAELIRDEGDALGPMTRAEKSLVAVFSLVALAWITQPWLIKPVMPWMNDTVIALLGALAMFVLPSGDGQSPRLLDWDRARLVPWGVLLLFGGGLAIADAFQASGLTAWLGNSLTGLANLPAWLLLAGLAAVVVLLSEIASNTAAATMLMPIMAALATATGLHPVLLMGAATLAASAGFMLPVATPPNAIVFGSQRLSMSQMVRAGFWLDLGSVASVALVASTWLPWVWGLG